MKENKQEDIIIDFKHYQAAHCENGVTSSLLKFYGINYSEPMVFGLGSGLFFSYLPFLKVNYIPVISFRPLPGMIFGRVSKMLGIKIKTRSFKDPEESMKALDANLEAGIPTGCRVGVYHLAYFPKAYRFHFNAHNIIVFGKKDGKYLISDPIMETEEELTYEELLKVRFAKGTWPPKGRMYHMEKTGGNIDLQQAIIKSFKKTCRHMLTIPIPLFGLKGIKYIARRMRKWPVKLGDKKARLYLGQVVRMLEEIGTGGAGFRFIYAAFLQESARELNQEWLNEVSAEMTESGDRWREFGIIAGRIFKEREGKTESYNAAADILMDIADREEKIFRRLKKVNLNR